MSGAKAALFREFRGPGLPLKRPDGTGKDAVSDGVLASARADGNYNRRQRWDRGALLQECHARWVPPPARKVAASAPSFTRDSGLQGAEMQLFRISTGPIATPGGIDAP